MLKKSYLFKDKMEITAQKHSLNGGNWQIEGFFRALF